MKALDPAIFSNLLLFVVTLSVLYNISQNIELEYSKCILSLVMGICVPQPKLKNLKQPSPTNDKQLDSQQQQ